MYSPTMYTILKGGENIPNVEQYVYRPLLTDEERQRMTCQDSSCLKAIVVADHQLSVYTMGNQLTDMPIDQLWVRLVVHPITKAKVAYNIVYKDRVIRIDLANLFFTDEEKHKIADILHTMPNQETTSLDVEPPTYF